MKTSKLLLAGAILLLSSCSNKNNQYDASGIFEATEVIVSSQGAGELLTFEIQEGQELKRGNPVGCIDTVQLHLKKMQLLATMKAVESRLYTVSKQIASIEQQISTQKVEQKRCENLLKSNAANQKQLDDINAQIALLETQLIAQKETLENNNRSVSGESTGLIMQVGQIEDQIKKCIISSPVNGTVLSKYAEQGEYAVLGKSLFKVADLSTMYLHVYITADQLTKLKIDQEVEVYADWGKSERRAYPGIVTWISDKAEFTPKTIQTRNERANLVYAVKVAVENDGYIKKGMYGELRVVEHSTESIKK